MAVRIIMQFTIKAVVYPEGEEFDKRLSKNELLKRFEDLMKNYPGIEVVEGYPKVWDPKVTTAPNRTIENIELGTFRARCVCNAIDFIDFCKKEMINLSGGGLVENPFYVEINLNKGFLF